MQNRLAEIKDIDPGLIDEEDDVESNDQKKRKGSDADSVELPEVGVEEFMQDFFEEVSSIKSGMAQIRRNIKLIEDSYAQSLVAVGAEQGSKTSEELEKLIDGTNLAASEVRNKLKEMDQENKQTSSKEKATAQYRIRVNVHGTLTKKFLELMQTYQEVQTKYKNKYREKVERQYKIVKPEATQEEIDDAMESGNTEVFAEKILDKQRHSAAKDALAYIENKHREILRLEQSIQELHQLFLDMAILVEAQGELIDQIEYNVNQSVAYTGQAVKELRKANKYQKKSRKKMCCLIIILVIILAVIGGVVGGIFGSKK
jgi:syntaxin 1B/2/3